jgi:hypothetical protein
MNPVAMLLGPTKFQDKPKGGMMGPTMRASASQGAEPDQMPAGEDGNEESGGDASTQMAAVLSKTLARLEKDFDKLTPDEVLAMVKSAAMLARGEDD